ncbi:unnamed protein product [Blepharisma stoltei]|uniref:Uncharacterized protein n=1 Tax=Blepharisma stoltei TaxID=1481888 RepID=A0AAU9KAK8_9CILI|nr:unnamed protein product [Blepharisma stoltei]
MKNEILSRLADLNIDTALAPYPFPAHLHDTYEFLYLGFAYVWFFNLLNCLQEACLLVIWVNLWKIVRDCLLTLK